MHHSWPLTGSGHITTIEFRTTVSHIPNHRVIKPLEWVQGLKAGTLPNVDYAFSFSSWEHDGLGRYGDPIDPWGDVKAVQRASCYVKPGEAQPRCSLKLATSLEGVDAANLAGLEALRKPHPVGDIAN